MSSIPLAGGSGVAWSGAGGGQRRACLNREQGRMLRPVQVRKTEEAWRVVSMANR